MKTWLALFLCAYRRENEEGKYEGNCVGANLELMRH